MDGFVERRIEGEIPSANLLIYDGPHFPCPGIHGILPALVADFVRKTQSNWPIPFRRDAHTRAYVIADPVDALSVVLGSKNVEAGFEPVREAVSDFDGFVELVIRGVHAIFRSLRAFEREIAV